eukprot:14446-Heterococcus_DN1.PRE.5
MLLTLQNSLSVELQVSATVRSTAVYWTSSNLVYRLRFQHTCISMRVIAEVFADRARAAEGDPRVKVAGLKRTTAITCNSAVKHIDGRQSTRRVAIQ